MAQLSYLAETKRIQPLTTQGSITDLDVRRIVYDARTAEGGSGAPLFGPSGRVIGVNFRCSVSLRHQPARAHGLDRSTKGRQGSGS
jgi:hypothetical protein